MSESSVPSINKLIRNIPASFKIKKVYFSNSAKTEVYFADLINIFSGYDDNLEKLRKYYKLDLKNSKIQIKVYNTFNINSKFQQMISSANQINNSDVTFSGHFYSINPYQNSFDSKSFDWKAMINVNIDTIQLSINNPPMFINSRGRSRSREPQISRTRSRSRESQIFKKKKQIKRI